MSIWDVEPLSSVWQLLLSVRYCSGKFASKRKLAFAFTLASVILGAVIYYMVYQFVLWLKMPSEDMKLFSAIVVAIFLAIPYLKEKRTLRKGASK